MDKIMMILLLVGMVCFVSILLGVLVSKEWGIMKTFRGRLLYYVALAFLFLLGASAPAVDALVAGADHIVVFKVWMMIAVLGAFLGGIMCEIFNLIVGFGNI